jgi:hypothetical protein
MKTWVTLFILFVVSNGAFAFTIEGEGLAGWQTSNLVVYFNPTDCPVDRATLTYAIDQATALWSSVPSADIHLSRSPEDVSDTPAEFLSGTARNVPLIACDTNLSGDLQLSANSIPAATKLGQDSPITYGAMLLNGEPRAGAEISQLTNEELRVVVAHEMGHLLGLGHSASPQALMYYSVSEKSLPVLTQDDMDGLSYLYPATGSLGCSAVHSHAESGSHLIGFLLLIAFGTLACGVARRLA